MAHNIVVVGVDGSAPSRVALRWAAREAAQRQVPLRVVCAYHFVVAGAYAPIGAEVAQEAEGTAKLIVDDAVTEAMAVAPGLEVSGVTVLGPAAQVLIEAGHNAALLVVGSRGHRGFAAALLGATSQHVATHAPCPVVVVRGRGDTAIGPVAVGVDGSESAERALDLAFQQAAMRGCALIAVRTYELPALPFGKGPVVVAPTPNETDEHARKELAGSVAARQVRYPDVPVDQLVTAGNAAQILVDVSRGARLVVVGTRGHGGFTGLLLGSIGLHLIHHADCPVVVARGPLR
jgi:nucleotide-binding universal stress UspA family protein